MSGSVIYLPWIARYMLQAEPDARFVFGDNTKRYGLGGQAKEMRGEPNAIGVATLWAPGKFYIEGDIRALLIVGHDLRLVSNALGEGRDVCVPADGLGTGLARLPQNAPSLHNFIVAFFRACPGEACPWEFI